MEKRFDWNSSQSGLVLATNDIGQLLYLLLLLYYGTHVHRPRLLAFSSLMYGVAAIAQSSPYFIFGPQTTPSQLPNIYQLNDTSRLQHQLLRHGYQSATTLSRTSHKEVATEAEIEFQSKVSLAIFSVAGIFEGMGSAPYFSIVLAFVDDMAGNLSGFFIGMLILLRLMSPTVGALFGAKVAHGLHESMSISSKQIVGGAYGPNWIGAWWLGFLIFGKKSYYQ